MAVDVIDKIKRFEKKEYIEEDLKVLTKVDYVDFLNYILDTFKNVLPVYEISKTEEDFYDKCNFVTKVSFYKEEDVNKLLKVVPFKSIEGSLVVDFINNSYVDTKIKPLFKLSEDFSLVVDMSKRADDTLMFRVPEEIVLYSPYRNILAKSNFALVSEDESLEQEMLEKLVLNYLSNKNVKKLTK